MGGVHKGSSPRRDSRKREAVGALWHPALHPLPPSAAHGAIELERLDIVVYIAAPPSTKKTPPRHFNFYLDGVYGGDATRPQVKLGRGSVNSFEIVSGLAPGDKVFLSDWSQGDANERVRIN